MSKVQVCEFPITESGDCAGGMVWVELANVSPITFSEFSLALPYLLGILFAAWSAKQAVKLILNR